MKQIVSVVAGIILGIVSNYLYDHLREIGALPNKPTVRFLSVLTAVVCALIFLVAWPNLATHDEVAEDPVVTPSLTLIPLQPTMIQTPVPLSVTRTPEATLAPTLTPTPTNLILHSSFDTGADGWEGYGDKAPLLHGGALCSTQQRQNRDPWAGIKPTQNISVTPGKQYSVVVRVNAERAVNAHVRVTYHGTGEPKPDNIPIDEDEDEVTPYITRDANEESLSLTTTAPAEAVDLLVRIAHGVEPKDVVVPDSILCIDDVQVFEE